MYLDRKSKHDHAFISWKFDVTSSGLVVESIQIKTEAVQTAPGKLQLQVTGDEKSVSRNLGEGKRVL